MYSTHIVLSLKEEIEPIESYYLAYIKDSELDTHYLDYLE